MTLCAICATGVLCVEHDRPAGAHYAPGPISDYLGIDRLLEELDEAAERGLVRRRFVVQFWTCPDGHSEVKPGEPLRQTVEWRGGVAHCLTGGCRRTSEG